MLTGAAAGRDDLLMRRCVLSPLPPSLPPFHPSTLPSTPLIKKMLSDLMAMMINHSVSAM